MRSGSSKNITLIIPKVMVIEFIIMATPWINKLPPKGGRTDIYTSRLIFFCKNLDWKKDSWIQYVNYFEVNEHLHELNDVNTERTTGAIALNSAKNDQGVYCFMNLTKGNVFVRYDWQEVPVPSNVIKPVQA